MSSTQTILPRHRKQRLFKPGEAVSDHRLFVIGRDYWQQYVKLNGAALKPKTAGIAKLSADTGIAATDLRKCIDGFLEC